VTVSDQKKHVINSLFFSKNSNLPMNTVLCLPHKGWEKGLWLFAQQRLPQWECGIRCKI